MLLPSRGLWIRFCFRGLQDFSVAYTDGILIFSHRWEEHLAYLCWVLATLHQAGLVANQKKSSLGHQSVQYLGFNVGGGKVWAVQDKVEALAKATPLTTRWVLHSFVGLANYYRRFVPGFASLVLP